MKIKLYQDDLPSNLNLGLTVAIDTETMGLNPIRDKLYLVQIFLRFLTNNFLRSHCYL